MSTTISSADIIAHRQAYRWTGTPNAATSESIYDGVVVRTNLFLSPQCTTNVAAYAGGSTAQANVQTPISPEGTTVGARVTWAAGNTTPGLQGVTGDVPAGATVNLSAWVYQESGAPLAMAAVIAGVVSSQTTYPTVVGKWVRVYATLTNTGADAHPSGFRHSGAASDAGSMLITDVLVEAVPAGSNNAPSPYFDGSTVGYDQFASSLPLLIDGWQESADTRNVVNEVVGGGVDYTLYPASLRSGQFVAVFQDEDAAAALVRMHQQPARFVISDDDRPSIEMTYIANGTITRALDDQSRDYWLVTIPYQEYDA